MNWKPISQESLEGIVSNALAAASPEERALFTQVAVTPTKWQLSPWGDFGGGFWAVAVMDDRVLWYNDIEDGFNVSLFTVRGVIPTTEYWCNQDELRMALLALAGKPQGKLGPPEQLGLGGTSGSRSFSEWTLIQRLLERHFSSYRLTEFGRRTLFDVHASADFRLVA